MAMQKYRADTKRSQPDGAIIWCSEWIGGPSVAKIENCRLDLAGEPRATVYITGESDTFFSIPAACSYKGCRVKGFVSRDGEDNLVFRAVYY